MFMHQSSLLQLLWAHLLIKRLSKIVFRNEVYPCQVKVKDLQLISVQIKEIVNQMNFIESKNVGLRPTIGQGRITSGWSIH